MKLYSPTELRDMHSTKPVSQHSSELSQTLNEKMYPCALVSTHKDAERRETTNSMQWSPYCKADKFHEFYRTQWFITVFT